MRIKLCDAKLASEMVSGLEASATTSIPGSRRRKRSPNLRSVAKTPEARQAGRQRERIGLVDKALAEERYDAAVQLATSAADLAATLRDTTFPRERREAQARGRHRMQQEAAEVQSAQERLARQSDDAAAHLLIGRFFCMERDDWDSGLPHLISGSDADLSCVIGARRRSWPARCSKPLDQVALADAWWDLADRRHDGIDSVMAKGMRNRAAYWYRRAMPQLSGFAQTKAQKRIAEAAAVVPFARNA